MATNPHAEMSWRAPGSVVAVPAFALVTAYALGALLLAGEGAVHVQQYFALFDQVAWLGPLFLANAVACLVAIAGMAYRPTRRLAALAGVVISVVALGSLVLSYGNGLFDWKEAGFRTPVAIALATEVGAVVALAAALAVGTARSRSPDRP
jgi:hypothetical protein